MVDQVPLFPVWVLPEWEDNENKKPSKLTFFPQSLNNWKNTEQPPLFEDIGWKTSRALVLTLNEADEQVKALLQELGNIVQEIEKTRPAQRRNVDFANKIITLWQQYEEVISLICEEGGASLNKVQIKILKFKKNTNLNVNYITVAGLIWNMRRLFNNSKNKPLPIDVTNWIICPIFWCSQEEEEGKMPLGGAYQD